MPLSHAPRRLLLAFGCALALAAIGSATALQKPGRTITRKGQVRLVTLNHSSFAFMVARTANDCDHVELWDIDSKGTWRFGKPGACANEGSTGNGISSLGVSGNRAAWVRYDGGNLRDWQLMTATTTQKTPKELRFVEQDVDLPAPMVVGDSTGDLGIPYAVGKQVVLLGSNGAAVFKHTETARIVQVTAGKGPAQAVVAALLETGEVVLLKADGSLAWTAQYQPGSVKTIALAPAGLIAQLPGAVEIRKPARTPVTVALPTGAVLTDFADGRLLYTLKNDVHSLKVSNGRDTLLLRGPAAGPAVVATQDTHGLGWARGASVNFACAACIGYGP